MSTLNIGDVRVGTMLEYIAETSGDFSTGDIIKVTGVHQDYGRVYYSNVYRQRGQYKNDWFSDAFIHQFSLKQDTLPTKVKYENKIAELEARKQEYKNKIEEIEEWIAVLIQANKICEDDNGPTGN